MTGSMNGTSITAGGGHVVLCYGVNSAGELLIADSAPSRSKIGIYENHKSASHIYTQGSTACDVVIVRPPKAS